MYQRRIRNSCRLTLCLHWTMLLVPLHNLAGSPAPHKWHCRSGIKSSINGEVMNDIKPGINQKHQYRCQSYDLESSSFTLPQKRTAFYLYHQTGFLIPLKMSLYGQVIYKKCLVCVSVTVNI